MCNKYLNTLTGLTDSEKNSINRAMNDYQSQVLTMKSLLLSVFKSFDEPTNGDREVYNDKE